MLHASNHASKYEPKFNMPPETEAERWRKATEREGLMMTFLAFVLCIDVILLCFLFFGGMQETAQARQDDTAYSVTPSDLTNWRVVESADHERLKRQWSNVIEQLDLIDEERAKMEEEAQLKQQDRVEEEVSESWYYPDYGYSQDAPVEETGNLKFNGVETDGVYQYTWYSENVLPGNGLDIPGRHVGEGGYVEDADGNICVASSDLDEGTIVETPYGTAKVYDSGCDSGVIDVYTNW